MKIILLFHCCLAVFLNAQAGKNTIHKTGTQMLVGTWSGNSMTAKNPISKTWQITRKADGSFSKFEMWAVRGRMQKINRKGKWWIQNSVYYEKNNSNEILQTNNYKLLKGHKIRFTSKNDGSVTVETLVK